MAPNRSRRRGLPSWLTVGLALVAGLVLAAPVAALSLRANGKSVGIPHVPTAAEAKQACKAAIEEDAQGRRERANADGGDSAVATVAGVDVSEPVRTDSGYTVDGTMRFQVASILGDLPNTVYVQCQATIDGSRLTTTVANR
jgi:hypothetical protein